MYKILRATAGLLLLGLGPGPVRGQITEKPTPVAPGRFLLEMDALSLTLNRDGRDKYTAVGVATTFLTTGLTADWDVQVGAELFLSQKFDVGGLSGRNSGIGDVYFRTKWRFYENKESGTAIALLPYVKLPTNTGGVGKKAMEGGLIVPWQTNLAGGVSMTAMAEVEFVRNDRDNGYDSFWYTSMALHRAVTKAIGLYGELTLGKSTGGAPWAGTLGGGVTFAFSENIWWDYALYRGLSHGAADWLHVLRLNWRF